MLSLESYQLAKEDYHLFSKSEDVFLEEKQRDTAGYSHRVRSLTGEKTKTSGSHLTAKVLSK